MNLLDKIVQSLKNKIVKPKKKESVRKTKQKVNRTLEFLKKRLQKKQQQETITFNGMELTPVETPAEQSQIREKTLNERYLESLEYLETNGFDTNEYRLNKSGVEQILMSGKEKEFAEKLEVVKQDIINEADRVKSLLSEDNESRKTLEARLGQAKRIENFKLSDKEYVEFVDIVNTDIFQIMEDLGLIESDQVTDLFTINVTTGEIKNYLEDFMSDYSFDGIFKDVNTPTFIDYVLTKIREQGNNI